MLARVGTGGRREMASPRNGRAVIVPRGGRCGPARTRAETIVPPVPAVLRAAVRIGAGTREVPDARFRIVPAAVALRVGTGSVVVRTVEVAVVGSAAVAAAGPAQDRRQGAVGTTIGAPFGTGAPDRHRRPESVKRVGTNRCCPPRSRGPNWTGTFAGS